MILEIKVKPHSCSMAYYCIYYRYKQKFNWFNIWKKLICVYDGANLYYDQPVLFSNFDDAVKFGKTLKDNPNLIKEHYQREDEKYEKALKQRNAYRNTRNKSKLL